MTTANPPTEPQEDMDEAAKPPFVLQMFEKSKPEGGPKLALHNDFQALAEKVAKLLPEGNVKTMMLERLLDTKDSVLRFIR